MKKFTLDQIKNLVDMGSNPTQAELNSIGLEGNADGTYSVVDMRLFNQARQNRVLKFDSSKAEILARYAEGRRKREQNNSEENKDD